MSLARALTTRRKASEPASNAYLGRAASQRAPNAKPIKRAEISLPVALLSSTNVLSYEAPDIVDAHNVLDRGGRYFSTMSAGSSVNSDNDSEHTSSDNSHETDATSVDLSSPETTHDQFTSFHAADYPFPKSSAAPAQYSHRSFASSHHSAKTSISSSANSPEIPTRAPSHSKSAHVLSHKRSVQRMASIPDATRQPPLPPQAITRDSTEMFSSAAVDSVVPSARSVVAAPLTILPSSSHPFGEELAQLNVAAEEFGHAVRNAEAEADSTAMRSKGLVRFCAAEYMEEIAALLSNPFSEDIVSYQPMVWI